MIRLLEYSPRIDEEGNETEAYRDFQNYLFSRPYGFVWDFSADKVVVYGIPYRISSLRHVPESVRVTCICGEGAGSNETGAVKVKTDGSLQGKGGEAEPLGVMLSKKTGNRLQILEDGCYAGGDLQPYSPPAVTLSSSIPQGEYLKGETLNDMVLTVTVTAGSEMIRDARILEGTKTLYAFEVAAGSRSYVFPLPTGIDGDALFSASISDGMEYKSNKLQYKFVLPVYCGSADDMNVAEEEILAQKALKASGDSFNNIYKTFNNQHIWMCCPESRVVKTITDENGFNIAAAFKKTAVKLTIAEEQYNYSLYMLDTKISGSDYQITFNF